MHLSELRHVVPEIRALGVDVLFLSGDRPELLYDSLGEWSAAAQASADLSVEAGWLLPEDAASILEEGTALAMSLGLS